MLGVIQVTNDTLQCQSQQQGITTCELASPQFGWTGPWDGGRCGERGGRGVAVGANSKTSMHQQYLEVLPHNEQDVLSCLESFWFCNARQKHPTGNWEVEGVVCCLEGHNTHVVVDGELG